jgi:histidyl-tRNA synthetase
VQNAPNIRKFLTPEENNQFKEIVQLLKAAKIKIKITPNLVRGLDYYNNFVFEVNSTLPALAGQPTLVGGGQYDQLVPQLNGPNNVGCKGFALGVERLLLASSKKQHRYFEFPNVDAVIVSLDESCDLAALEIAEKIRYNGLFAITRIGTYKLEKYFNLAKEVNAKNLVIIGKNEMKKKSVIIKDQVTMHQTTVLVTDVVRRLKLARKKN